MPLYLSGGANITLSGNSNTICIVGGGGGGAQSWSAAGNTQATMNTTATGNQMYLSGAANITVGMSNNSILISGNNPGAAAENNWMTLLGANVSSNSSASGSTIGWSGSNITLAGTNNSQIIISAPATSSIVGVNGISVATNASTISISGLLPTLQHYSNGNGGFTALSIVGQGSMSVVHDYEPFYVTGTAANIGLIVSLPAVNSTGSANISLGMGIYTLNGSTLSLASSGSANNAFTWSSNTQNPGVTGARLFSVPMNINMTPGQYWMAAWLSTGTTNTGATVSMMGKDRYTVRVLLRHLDLIRRSTEVRHFPRGIYSRDERGITECYIDSSSNVCRYCPKQGKYLVCDFQRELLPVGFYGHYLHIKRRGYWGKYGRFYHVRHIDHIY